MNSAPPLRRHPGRLDGVAIAAAALGLYAALGQSAEFIDSSGYLVSSARGTNDNVSHVAFTPMLTGWTRLLALLPLTHLQAARLLSAAMGAVAALVVHASCRTLAAPRAVAVAATALVAFCPAVVFGATVVCPYVPMLGVGSFGLLAAVSGARAAGPRGAGLAFGAGLCTGVASTVHASGNLLPIAIAAVLLGASSGFDRRSGCDQGRGAAPMVPLRRALRASALCAAGHAAFLALLVVGGPALGLGHSTARAAQTLWTGVSWLKDLTPLPTTAWRDWLWPFFPVSVLSLVALAAAATRRLAAAALATTAFYAVVSLCLLHGGVIRGQYMLPAVIPAALASAAFLRPPRLAALAILVSIAGGVFAVRRHDDPARGREYAAGLREVAAARPTVLIIGINEDVEAIFGHVPDQPFFFLPDLAMLEASIVAAALPQLDAWIAARTSEGKDVFLTAAARRWLDKMNAMPVPSAAPVLLSHFSERYALQPVHVRGFVAERLRPR